MSKTIKVAVYVALSSIFLSSCAQIHSYAPYHWEDRKADWERAEVLLNEG